MRIVYAARRAAKQKSDTDRNDGAVSLLEDTGAKVRVEIIEGLYFKLVSVHSMTAIEKLGS